jgi:hypothetical protein
MAQLQADYLAIVARASDEVDTTPSTWTSPAPAPAPGLDMAGMLAVDTHLNALGLCNLRAKSDFARRLGEWLSSRITLVAAWSTTDATDESKMQTMGAFAACHHGLGQWHDAHSQQLQDIGRSQDLFDHAVDFEVILLPLLKWGNDAMINLQSSITAGVVLITDALTAMCPSEATLKSPLLLVDIEMQNAVRDSLRAGDVTGAVVALADAQAMLTRFDLMTKARSDMGKTAIRLGRLTVGTEFALSKLAACKVAPNAVAAVGIAVAARDKVAQKKILLPPAVKAALDKIAVSAPAGAV